MMTKTKSRTMTTTKTKSRKRQRQRVGQRQRQREGQRQRPRVGQRQRVRQRLGVASEIDLVQKVMIKDQFCPIFIIAETNAAYIGQDNMLKISNIGFSYHSIN